jgi:hypothetical protein
MTDPFDHLSVDAMTTAARVYALTATRFCA